MPSWIHLWPSEVGPFCCTLYLAWENKARGYILPWHMVLKGQLLNFYQYDSWKEWYIEKIIWNIPLGCVLDIMVVWSQTRRELLRTLVCSPRALPRFVYDITFHWEKPHTTLYCIYLRVIFTNVTHYLSQQHLRISST